MISALIAYNFMPKKPLLNLEIADIQNVNNLKNDCLGRTQVIDLIKI